MLWRRLDAPGHDACRLTASDSGWVLEGAAVFRHEAVPARLNYHVTCDHHWRAQEGRVQGWIGMESLDFRLARSEAGGWTLNGARVTGVEDCLDLDFSFTPSTNLPTLRRLALDPGQAAEASAAWLNLSTRAMEPLLQRYERRAEMTYRYEAPGVGYSALIEVAPTGFIVRYPGLWEAVR